MKIAVNSIVAASILALVGFSAGVAQNFLSSPSPDVVVENSDVELEFDQAYFENQFNSIEALGVQINEARIAYEEFSSIASESSADQRKLNRLRSSLLLLRNQQSDMIANYNSKTNILNREIFKSSGLPERILQQ
ncbi:hypothetical protein AU106_gp177 [Sinorhizobium phage phiM9]|uniref:Uncharacterized protein n=1 Tax=Sinorhizobium phage phiM9 TaxID=1636182 RepID=A0A0F6R7N2_9CAUD|nr:hypothetical protein AU106_gp177 [Sinorhizobium phage phiM9]AKE44808.1 hypothetical protein Sm_phiM9_181 [Sinorhizobium phage phiM9]